MREEDIVDIEEDGMRVLVRAYRGGKAAPRPYPLSARQWRRAVRLLGVFGEARCLELMDERAEAALERGDLATCLAWRDLMVAVHEVCREEPGAGQRTN